MATPAAELQRPVPRPAAVARLGWLDLLRGIAALIVALHHATYYFVPELRARLDVGWFEPGKYGVLVFFLVSGYIIPASLERHGRVRDFWISRLFRIYPLLLVVCALTLLPFLLGVRGLRGGLERYDPVVAVLAHLTMLQDVLAVPNLINVLWTLSYEMVFYLLVVALFVTGAHRRSTGASLLLVTAALTVGALLPTTLLSRTAGVGPVVLAATAVLVLAIAAAVSGRPALSTAGGLLGGVLAGVLVAVNGRAGAWEGLVVLAVMFTGTVLHRAEHRQIRRRVALPAAAAVLAAAVGAGAWNARIGLPAEQAQAFTLYWGGSVVLAALTFAAGWALRGRRIPRPLTALGTVSFSVYLLHPVLLMAFDQFGLIPEREDPLRLLVFVVVLLVASWASYRWIEAPAQRLGRRLSHR